jgi:two-component system OmpR family response regulator/two-component system copper resistance phosphate regulon response regulator CusR
MNLLLVEDDMILGRTLQRGLSEATHPCAWVKSGTEGLTEAKSGRYDAIILDWMLPDLSGLEMLAQLRQTSNTTPVLFLTAMGSIDDRVVGLNSGADDYLVKPFAFAELIARLEAIARRSKTRLQTELIEGPICLNLTTRRALREGKEIDLTPTEFTLLEFLMRNANRPVTRRMLCEHLWDANWEGVTNVIEVHINRLRAKMDRGFGATLIHTVRGLGYAFRTH